MVDTRRAVQALADDHAAEAAGLLVASYRLAAGLSGRLGLIDLAAHAAHCALDTACFITRPELDEAARLALPIDRRSGIRRPDRPSGFNRAILVSADNANGVLPRQLDLFTGKEVPRTTPATSEKPPVDFRLQPFRTTQQRR